MKNDEPFNPHLKSSISPSDIRFELASESHSDAISDLMAERNPEMTKEGIQKKTQREIVLNKIDPQYRLFVAISNNEVVGFCRFYHSSGLPLEKIKFPSPEGWYAMGTLVSKNHRRQNIAKFLFQERLKVLKELKAQTLYSIVDAKNETSIRMHQSFGFSENQRGRGFLHLDFPDSNAILFKLDLTSI